MLLRSWSDGSDPSLVSRVGRAESGYRWGSAWTSWIKVAMILGKRWSFRRSRKP